jgi:hypothetical protein
LAIKPECEASLPLELLKDITVVEAIKEKQRVNDTSFTVPWEEERGGRFIGGSLGGLSRR